MLLPGSARAQTAIRLKQLTIRVWPEFDKPGALVFLIGQTADGTALPAEITISLPDAATVNAIAYLDASNTLTDKVPSRVDGGKATITTPNGNFHIEFYDATLKANGAQRTYTYTWQQAFAVDQIIWEIQQPAGAANFKADPPGGTLITDQNGLSVYQLQTPGVAAGQAASISVGYDNTSGKLSAELLPTSQPGSAPAAASQPSGDNTPMLVVGALIGLALIAGAYFGNRRGLFERIGVRVVGAEGEPPRKPRGRAAKKLGKKPAPGQRFCPQCGQSARPGDVFCRNCGTKLHG